MLNEEVGVREGGRRRGQIGEEGLDSRPSGMAFVRFWGDSIGGSILI